MKMQEHCMTEFLRMSGMYWGLTALQLMDRLDSVPKEDVVAFVQDCFHDGAGGFSPAKDHDPHLLYTLSAVQILAMLVDFYEFENFVDYDNLKLTFRH